VIARLILVRALDRPTVRRAPQYPVRSGGASLDLCRHQPAEQRHANARDYLLE
jgi:hypothetical protein